MIIFRTKSFSREIDKLYEEDLEDIAKARIANAKGIGTGIGSGVGLSLGTLAGAALGGGRLAACSAEL